MRSIVVQGTALDYHAGRHSEICVNHEDDAGRLNRDSQSTSPGPLCYIVKVMDQGQTS